ERYGRAVLMWNRCRLWGNWEDGIDGLRGHTPEDFEREWREQMQWYLDTKGWSDAKRIIIWSAWRNPVGNLRYVPILNCRIEPSRIRHVGSDDAEGRGWFFCWQGFYSTLRVNTAR